MTVAPKYRIIEADTLEARRQHRIIIEQELQKTNLTPAQRLQLERDLHEAQVGERAAELAKEEEEWEEEEEEKEKDSDKGDGKDGDGKSGDGKSGDGKSGDDGSGDQKGSAGGSEGGGDGAGDTGGLPDLELFELLFFAEQELKRSYSADAVPDYDARDAVAAATLLYNRDEHIAQINEPYAAEPDNRQGAPSSLLPSLEKYAAAKGARIMQLRVRPEAVDLLTRKFGYTPYGKAVIRNGASLQKMRKSLIKAILATDRPA